MTSEIRVLDLRGLGYDLEHASSSRYIAVTPQTQTRLYRTTRDTYLLHPRPKPGCTEPPEIHTCYTRNPNQAVQNHQRYIPVTPQTQTRLYRTTRDTYLLYPKPKPGCIEPPEKHTCYTPDLTRLYRTTREILKEAKRFHINPKFSMTPPFIRFT